MGFFKKQDKKSEKELEKLPLKNLERALPQDEENEEEEEKVRKEKGSPARSGKF